MFHKIWIGHGSVFLEISEGESIKQITQKRKWIELLIGPSWFIHRLLLFGSVKYRLTILTMRPKKFAINLGPFEQTTFTIIKFRSEKTLGIKVESNF